MHLALWDKDWNKNIAGDDQRAQKISTAIDDLVARFTETPTELVAATLAALDPDIPETEPMGQAALDGLRAHWQTFDSVYVDFPVGLVRGMLWEACTRACADDPLKAAVVSWTGLDVPRLRRLGSEAASVRTELEQLARKAEEIALAVHGPATTHEPVAASAKPAAAGNGPRPFKIDREQLLWQVAATVGPNYKGTAVQTKATAPNQYLPSNPGPWVEQYVGRMSDLLADELERAVAAAQKDVATLTAAFRSEMAVSLEAATKRIDVQRRREQLRLDVLWWSTALYSPAYQCSYRAMPSERASVIMAFELATLTSGITPASVGYLLAETVRSLAVSPERVSLPTVFDVLTSGWTEGATEWWAEFSPPPTEGRWSLRDAALAVARGEADAESALGRAGLGDAQLSLPDLGHGIFRQEVAVRLAAQDS